MSFEAPHDELKHPVLRRLSALAQADLAPQDTDLLLSPLIDGKLGAKMLDIIQLTLKICQRLVTSSKVCFSESLHVKCSKQEYLPRGVLGERHRV